MAELPHDITRNTERFSGFSSDYDAFRPITPPVIVELLCQLAQVTGSFTAGLGQLLEPIQSYCLLNWPAAAHTSCRAAGVRAS